jgi:hypothetical protein
MCASTVPETRLPPADDAALMALLSCVRNTHISTLTLQGVYDVLLEVVTNASRINQRSVTVQVWLTSYMFSEHTLFYKLYYFFAKHVFAHNYNSKYNPGYCHYFARTVFVTTTCVASIGGHTTHSTAGGANIYFPRQSTRRSVFQHCRVRTDSFCWEHVHLSFEVNISAPLLSLRAFGVLIGLYLSFVSVGLRFAPEFDYAFFDDDACFKFIDHYFVPAVGALFRDIVAGPHKADLFRYCYLYEHTWNARFVLPVACSIDHTIRSRICIPMFLFVVFFLRSFFSGTFMAGCIWTLKPN